MYETLKRYLSDHWIPMLFSMAGSTIVFIYALITLYISFRVDYASLKESVMANTASNDKIIHIHEEILQEITKVNQKQDDDHVLIEDIHLYILGNKK
jgi:hypothetical protein